MAKSDGIPTDGYASITRESIGEVAGLRRSELLVVNYTSDM
ncbi:hypothetical protein PC129_g13615 [Phytophthora cactorum]|uniref:Uncharacterized protein n=1 Tax=Phytophthora cactorum TaxID=29920 RepID=A0A8T1CPB2_9STRA|nr:hypothetical protein Pcac1_g22919 [Phytophthora cactorum]KAG2813620.1 hypothetical protein PC111_g14319 [Phytophthora cactorum]KAG2815599.1 hypothetical protein PC112_g13812 [Phytophthora cactorum]KAG2853911.1 hypothetical protein PC113_g13769 [Phytophthora cactorum]KAG2922103.1 hypothetical protein PC114_g5404 [Phytophthora cactorum]